MKAIMVLGDSKRGKTTTFWALRERLKSLGWIETLFDEEANPDNDFVSEMEYKGEKLALVSMGDFSWYSVFKMNKYNSKNYDVLVFACNMGKARPQNRFVQFEDRHIVEKNEPNDIDNERAINEIVEHISRLV